MRGHIGPEAGRQMRQVPTKVRQGGRRVRGAAGTYGAAAILMLAVAVLAAGIPAANLLSPPPPPVVNQTLTLDGRFANFGNTSYFDVEIVGLSLVGVGYDPSGQGGARAKITQSTFTEPSNFQERGNHTAPDPPWIIESKYRRVEVGRMDMSSPNRQIVAVGTQVNGSGIPGQQYEGVLRVFELGSVDHKATWIGQQPPGNHLELYDIAMGPLGPGPNDWWVAAGHKFDQFTGWSSKGAVIIGQYSSGFIPPPYYQENKGSWLWYTAVTVAELGGPPGLEIVLAGRSENKTFLQVAKFDNSQAVKVVNLANTTSNVMPESIPWAVKVADLDGDLLPEIVMGGVEGNQPFGSTQNRSRVSVWNWDGGTQLTKKFDRVWTGVNIDSAVFDIEVQDFITGGGLEIASIGYNRNSSQNLSMAGELNLMDATLKELDKLIWFGSDTDHWGMSSGDPDGDGTTEIVSVGMKMTGSTEVGEYQFVEIPELRLAAAMVSLLSGAALLSRRALRPIRARRP